MHKLVISPLPEFVALGECVIRKGWIHPQETLPHYKLIICRGGDFTFKVDSLGKIELKEWDYVLIPPHTTWGGLSKGKKGDKYWWEFFNAVKKSKNASSLTLPLVGTCTNADRLEMLIEQLMNRFYSAPEQKLHLNLSTANILAELSLAKAAGQTQPKNRPRSPKAHNIAHQVILYIQDNLQKPFSLSDLAAHFKMNPAYLRRVFKDATGSTPGQYLKLMRIDRAKQLLSSDEVMVSQIAYQVGFEDVSYFSRVFKKITGYWPSDFRGKQTVIQNVDGEFYPFVRRLK